MPRIRFRNFLKGLWLMGARDQCPPNTLRRASAIAAVQTGPIRTRWGATTLTTFPTGYDLHSIVRYNDVRYVGAGSAFYAVSPFTLLFSSLTGNRLTFVKAPPTSDKTDYLFVTGGGNPFKIAPDLSTSLWGIDAPIDSTTASLVAASSKTIDTLDDTNTWTPAACSIFFEATTKQEGTASMRMVVAASTVGSATSPKTLDLTTFGTGTIESSDVDMIVGWVRVDNPSNIVQLQIQFDVAGGNFASDYYTRTINVSDLPPSTQITEQTVGIGSSTQGIVVEPGTFEAGPVTPSEQTATVTITTAIGAWVFLRIPKNIFQRSGDGGGGWATVAAMRLIAQTNSNGPAIIYWDDFFLTGSTGMLGPYKYFITFLNEITGTRSNPHPNPITISNVLRQPVLLQPLPVTADSQVTAREVWRTVGGGSVYFLDATVSMSTSSYVDRVSDFFGFNGPNDSSSLQSTVLPLDNDPPGDSFTWTFGPLNGVVYWTRDTSAGARGRVYFSAVGRAEAVAGFVEASTDDDPTQAGVIWNGRAFVFTQSKIIEIIGTGEGSVANDIFGAPGTTAPYSVVTTPYGVAYMGLDGPRLFNGVYSRLIAIDAVELIFRGEAAEDVPAFSTTGDGVVGAFSNDEYLVSDGTTTLAVNLASGTWRVQGSISQGTIRALYREPDTTDLLGTTTGPAPSVYILEDPGVTLDGAVNIPFEVQTPDRLVDDADVGLCQRIYIDVDPAGSTITPTACFQAVAQNGVVQYVEVVLPPFTGSGRQTVEYAQNRTILSWAVRLTGSVAGQPVTVYGIEADIFVPQATGQPTP